MSDGATNPQATVADESQEATPQATPSGDDSNAQPDATAASSTSSDGGGELPKFHYQFSKELQGNERLGQFKRPDDLAKAYLDAADRMERMIEMPGEDATDEQRAEFRKKLGRPETPDEYDLQKPRNYPNELPWSEDMNSDYAKRAHDLGLSKAQAEELFTWSNEHAVGVFDKAVADQRKYFDQQRETLKEELGDQYNEQMRLVDRTMSALGIKERLRQLGADQDPELLKGLMKIAPRITEDRFFAGEAGGGERKAADWYPNTDWSKV